MLDFHEKRKLKAWLYSKPFIAFLFISSAFLSTSVYDRYLSEREMAGKREALQTELVELEGRAAALEADVARLESDRGIEAEIRDRYEVAKRGEQVVIVVGEEGDETGSSTPSETEEPVGFFERISAFFRE